MSRLNALVLIAPLCLLLITACTSGVPDTAIEPTAAGEIAQAAEETAPTSIPTAQPAPTETVAPPTPTAEPTAEAAAPPEVEVPPTATVEPTLVPNPEVLESNCLNCHSNQQLLMDLAQPEEVPEESESSGVG